jgi:hypothetical protein
MPRNNTVYNYNEITLTNGKSIKTELGITFRHEKGDVVLIERGTEDIRFIPIAEIKTIMLIYFTAPYVKEKFKSSQP